MIRHGRHAQLTPVLLVCAIIAANPSGVVADGLTRVAAFDSFAQPQPPSTQPPRDDSPPDPPQNPPLVIDPNAVPSTPPPQPAFNFADLSSNARNENSNNPAVNSRSVPYMAGDFFRPRSIVYFDAAASAVVFGNGGGDRPFKIADSGHPVPQDRVFTAYHVFHEALRTPTDTNVGIPITTVWQDYERFVFGVEKTFFNGNASVELRMNVGRGLGNPHPSPNNAGDDLRARMLGDTVINVKKVLHRTPNFVVSAGTGITIPTADDIVFLDSLNDEAGRIHNDSVHVLPFIGAAGSFGRNWFSSATLQFDVDANGSRVSTVDVAGVYQDQTLLHLDGMIGAWVWRGTPNHVVRSVAVQGELHYTSTLQDSDDIPDPNNATFFSPFNRFDVLNIGVATTVQIGEYSHLTFGGMLWTRREFSLIEMAGVEDRMPSSELFIQFRIGR